MLECLADARRPQGAADTAPSGGGPDYLTNKLAAPEVVIAIDDYGTENGIEKGWSTR